MGWFSNYFQNWKNNFSDGYQPGDFVMSLFGRDSGSAWNGYDPAKDFNKSSNGVINSATDMINNHGLDATGNIDVNPADPTSSASNVINYDPQKSAQENLLGYAKANNSASAYESYLANAYSSEMANSAISRAIADAEANGISKYQLFQSGNAGAATPSSAVGTSASYENAMNRRSSWNEKELAALVSIVSGTLSSAIKAMIAL